LLQRAVDGLVRATAIAFPVTPLLEAKLVEAGLITRTYVVRASQIVPCGVDAHDRFVLTRLVSDLAGAKRVDVEIGGHLMPDVPFASSGVAFVASGDVLRKMPSMRLPMRLAADQRPIAEYVLDHTAFEG
jgi:hypothetical protein